MSKNLSGIIDLIPCYKFAFVVCTNVSLKKSLHVHDTMWNKVILKRLGTSEVDIPKIHVYLCKSDDVLMTGYSQSCGGS